MVLQLESQKDEESGDAFVRILWNQDRQPQEGQVPDLFVMAETQILGYDLGHGGVNSIEIKPGEGELALLNVSNALILDNATLNKAFWREHIDDILK